MNDMLMLSESAEGTRNKERENGNQDYVKMFQNNKIVCASVNDGCSACAFPQIAGAINAEVAEAVACSIAFSLISEAELKQILAAKYAEMMKLSGLPKDELCATTAFVAVNKDTQSFIAFNCGDSCVLTFDSNLRTHSLLKAKNGFRRSLTYFTNDAAAVRHIGEVRKGVLGSDIAGFILYTDGAEQIAAAAGSEDNMAGSLLRSLYTDEYESEAQRLLSELSKLTSDDISFVMIAPPDDPRTGQY